MADTDEDVLELPVRAQRVVDAVRDDRGQAGILGQARQLRDEPVVIGQEVMLQLHVEAAGAEDPGEALERGRSALPVARQQATRQLPVTAARERHEPGSVLDEDVDAIGVSVLSGAHMTIFPRLLEHLGEEGADDVLVIAGGTILPEDAAALEEAGVARVFGVDTPLDEIVDFIREAVAERRGAHA